MPKGVFKHNRRGKNNPFYGRHHTEEAKEANRQAHLGVHSNKGVPKSEKQKEEISQTLKKLGKWRGQNNPKWKDGRSKDIEHLRQQWVVNKQRRRARIRGAKGNFTVGEWELLKKQYNYTCPACGRKEPEIKLTPDHIIPLSRGGSNNIENIQPLCINCNCKKYTKIIKY